MKRQVGILSMDGESEVWEQVGVVPGASRVISVHSPCLWCQSEVSQFPVQDNVPKW
jgi:hypothetical protein